MSGSVAAAELALPGTAELGHDEVHVWLVIPEDVVGASVARCDALLGEAEVERRDRYVFERDRHVHRVTWALVRSSLSRYGRIAPAEWRFGVTERGRPFVAPELLAAPLDFNVSHTDGLVACAVTRRPEVGIDVENHSRVRDTVTLAQTVFSAMELEQLRRLSAAPRQRLFFELWTLKEAYIKARGLGLSLPLDRFWFDRTVEGPIRIGIASELADDPSSWYFELHQPTEKHQLALAVRSDAPVRVRIRRVTSSFYE